MTEAWVQSLFDEEPDVYGPKPAGRRPRVQQRTNHGGNKESRRDFGEAFYNTGNPLGAPPLDWWNVSEEEVRRRLILAMCPERVCRTRGAPSRRIVEAVHDVEEQRTRRTVEMSKRSDRSGLLRADNGAGPFLPTKVVTTGWTDCGHDDWRPGVVLDPFAGAS